jgi:hypothetical protein
MIGDDQFMDEVALITGIACGLAMKHKETELLETLLRLPLFKDLATLQPNSLLGMLHKQYGEDRDT